MGGHSWQGSPHRVCWPTVPLRADVGGEGRRLPGPKRLLQKAAPTRLRQTKGAPHPACGLCDSVPLAPVVSSQVVLQLDEGAPHTWAAQAALLSGMLSLQGHLLCWPAEQMAGASGTPGLPARGRASICTGAAPAHSGPAAAPPAICSSADLCAPQSVRLIKTIMGAHTGLFFPSRGC